MKNPAKGLAVAGVLWMGGCAAAPDPALLQAIERIESGSIEDREEASAVLEKASVSVLPLLEDPLRRASCHETAYRILRAADLILVRERVRILPCVTREHVPGDQTLVYLEFDFDVREPMACIGGFRVVPEKIIDATGLYVAVESIALVEVVMADGGQVEFSLDGLDLPCRYSSSQR